MKTRGQITIFIIIGLVLLFLAGLYFAVSNMIASSQLESTEKQALDFNQKAENVNFYVTQCLKNAAIFNTKYFGMSGSLTKSPEGVFYVLDKYPTSYLRSSNNNYLPPISTWEKTLANLINLNNPCDLSSFEKDGLIITTEESTSQVSIGMNNVIFKIKYPIKIKQNELSKEYSDYTITLPYKLGYIHNLVNDMITEEIKSPGYIPTNIILDYNLNVTSLGNQEKGTALYFIRDEEGTKNEYTFIFADKE